MSTEQQSLTDNRLTSDRYGEFLEALEILYIKNNMGGRNQFAGLWPDAALYIFGEELQRFDREGTPDRERRAKLETEADERRLGLIEIADTLEAKSVDKGVLQVEYVRDVIGRLGRKLSLYLYSRWLVDRFVPPLPGEETAAAPEASAPQSAVPVQDAGMSMPEDPMDKIKPISVEQDMSPPPAEEPESPPPPKTSGLNLRIEEPSEGEAGSGGENNNH